MTTLNFIPILILLLYHNSAAHITSLYVLIYLYLFNYVLCNGSIVDITTIIIFLNKLNSALLNPTIFLMICLFTNLFFFKNKLLNIYRNVLIINLATLITNNNALLTSTIELYKVDLKFESTLTNGLLIIHPIILYVYYSSLLLFLFYTLYKGTSPMNNNYYNPFLIWRYQIYQVGVVALLLGSWWSHQELNWGGFWSWDLVEIFLLTIVIYDITIAHTKVWGTLYIYKIIFFLSNFILYVVSVRFNLINSIHNFFAQDSTLCKITYVIILFSIFILILLKKLYKSWARSKTTRIFLYTIAIVELIYILLLVYVVIVYSYFYLLNSSSNTLINIVPIFIYTITIALVTYKVTFLQAIFPFLESAILLTIVTHASRLHYLSFVHVAVLLFYLAMFIFYGTNILLPILDLKNFVVSLSISNVTYLISSSIWIGDTPTKYTNIAIINLNLFIENYVFAGLRGSAASLVICSIPLTAELCGLTIFIHKFFIKLSFIDNLMLLIVFLLLLYFSYKNTYPIKNYY